MTESTRTTEQVESLQPAPVNPFTGPAQRLQRAGLDPADITRMQEAYAGWDDEQRGSFRNALASVSDRDLADEDGQPGPMLARFTAGDPPVVTPGGSVQVSSDGDTGGVDATDPAHPQYPRSSADWDTESEEEEPEGEEEEPEGEEEPAGHGHGTDDGSYTPIGDTEPQVIAHLEAAASADEVERVLDIERRRADRYAGGRRGVLDAGEKILADKRAAQDG